MKRLNHLPEKEPTLQNNAFFASPQIFFGAHQFPEERWMHEDERLQISDPWKMQIDPPFFTQPEHKIGLFILWSESNEAGASEDTSDSFDCEPNS